MAQRQNKGIFKCLNCDRILRDYSEYELLGQPAPKGKPPKFCNPGCGALFRRDAATYSEDHPEVVRGYFERRERDLLKGDY